MRNSNERSNWDLLFRGILIGYCRDSRVDQNLNLQRDALEGPVAHRFMELNDGQVLPIEYKGEFYKTNDNFQEEQQVGFEWE